MARKLAPAIRPGEHPLMSHRVLRGMYTGITSARAHLSGARPLRGTPPLKGALAGVSCWVAPLAGVAAVDLVFDCRSAAMASHLHPSLLAAPHTADGTARLNMAIGAATVGGRLSTRPIVIAFFERHEAEKPAWIQALAMASDLPLLLIVLPRWKGRETPMDLGRLSRAANVPGIPVDAGDPIALYRVAQESITRARAGGGAALLEAVHLPGSEDAAHKLAAYLLARDVASQGWIDAHSFPLADAKSR